MIGHDSFSLSAPCISLSRILARHRLPPNARRHAPLPAPPSFALLLQDVEGGGRGGADGEGVERGAVGGGDTLL